MKTNLWDETVSEEWRTVVKAPKYEVSSFGRVRSVATGKVLKLAMDRYGYPKISLMTDSLPYYATVHRLVAIAFLPNPENKAQVNHIDGVKTNNHYKNHVSKNNKNDEKF